MNKILFDSSAYYILLSLDHSERKKVLDCFKKASKLIITDYIYDESLTLVRMKINISKSIELQKTLKNNQMVEFHDITSKDRCIADKIFASHVDKDYSYTDCTTFAFLKRIKVNTILTTDKHFIQHGLSNVTLLKDQ